MKGLDITEDRAMEIVWAVALALYGDTMQDGRYDWNPDKEWNADTLDAIDAQIRPHIPFPKENKS